MQLLQQPPLLDPCRIAEQHRSNADCSVCSCYGAVLRLSTSLTDPPRSFAGVSALQGLLQHKAARSVGTVLAWVLQQPQQLQLSELAAYGSYPCTAPALLLQSSECLEWMADAIFDLDRDSAAPLAAAMTQQLEQSGLLNCLPNILQPFTHPDQQYPSSTRPWFSSSLEMLFGVIRSLCGMWYTSIPHAPVLVPPVLRVALPLLQQLQRCIPPTPAPCHGPSTSASSSSASSSASGPAAAAAAAAASVNSKVLCALHRAKIGWAFLLWTLGNAARQPQGLPADCAGLLDQLLHEPDAATLLLQLLVAGAAQQHHTYEQQQRGHPVGNSSRTFKQQQQKQQKQRNALDLSHIPAFHLDMLHLLPGGAAYLDAAAAADHSSAQERIEENRHTTRVYLMMLEIMINRSSNGYPGSAPLQSDAPVLSAAAVRLALELQLLAAADVLEQQQQRRADPAGEQRAIERLA